MNLDIKAFCFLGLGLLITALNTSCEKFQTEAEIPSYIKISEINLQTNFSTQGSNSHKITDAWVYVDDQQIGVFELPANFPVLASLNHKLKILPGIKMNGIATTRIAYPFYKPFEQNIVLEKNKILEIKPEFSYYPTASFLYLEDFESAGIKLEKLLVSDTGLVQINDKSIVFEGNYCGGIFLDNTKPNFSMSSLNLYPFTKTANSPVFLELNYKNNQKFNVGIIVKYPSGTMENDFFTINPSSYWNKLYLNLTEEINAYPGSIGYYLYFRAQKDPNVNQAAIYLDNLKIVQFQ